MGSTVMTVTASLLEEAEIRNLIRYLSCCASFTLSVEKMRFRCGMCESGGGGMEGVDCKAGRISCCHSPWVNHRK